MLVLYMLKFKYLSEIMKIFEFSHFNPYYQRDSKLN